MTRADFAISVVVPVFNNSSILPETIDTLSNFLSESFAAYELIFVDDGSSDNSWQLLIEAKDANQNIVLFRHEKNLDQPAAVVTGCAGAKFDVIANIDADLPLDLRDFKLIAEKAFAGTELVYGIRVGFSGRSWWRRLGSFLVRHLFRLLYDYPMTDFGNSAGAVRRSLIERMRRQPFKVWMLKIELMRHAESYAEIEVRPPNHNLESRSSYSLRKLGKRFFAVIWYRIIR